MNLIHLLRTFGSFGIRISRVGGNPEFWCRSSSLESVGSSIRIPLDDVGYLDIKASGRGFHFALTMGDVQDADYGRYEFGPTDKRYFAYKFGRTLVEFLKAPDANPDVVVIPPAPMLPEPIPSRSRYPTEHDKPDWRESLGSGNGFTRSAHTHKN
ncbi:hypothetical protein IV02_04725 [Pseudomonas syringae]|uniref:Uncharacterized protein n=1 Tax=Pseudomonas syringae TaxID=317 RepID=A0A085VF41_PSESX|nr:hypothetical protein IV02_04725 [Pseudomonas syringae]